MNKQENTNPPAALMLLSSHCAHCPGVLDSLAKMIKKGDLGSLKIINLEQHPEAMQEYKVRSVPWVRIGKHELTGAQTLEALMQRATWALDDQNKDENTIADFDFLLSDGQVNKVIDALQKDESKMAAIMSLLGDSATVLSTRIGIGVVFEEFAESALIKAQISQLKKLTTHDDSRVRADVLHYLGMTADSAAISILEAVKKDSDEDINEIIADSLEHLHSQVKT